MVGWKRVVTLFLCPGVQSRAGSSQVVALTLHGKLWNVEGCASMRPSLLWLYLRFPFNSFFKNLIKEKNHLNWQNESTNSVVIWEWEVNLNNLIWALCVQRRERGYEESGIGFLTFVFSSPGRLWQWCSCRLLKGKKLQFYLQTWHVLQVMTRAGVHAHSVTNWGEEHLEK